VEEELRNGLRWMGRTVAGRASDAALACATADRDLASRVTRGDPQVNLAHDRLQDIAFQMLKETEIGSRERAFLRAVVFVAQNLERIGDCAVSIAKRVLRDDFILPGGEAAALLKQSAPLMREGVTRALSAFLSRRLDRAKAAMAFESQLDTVFRAGLDALASAGAGRSAAEVAGLTLVFKSIEKAGDHIQNITEQALYFITGQRIKYRSLAHLEEMLGALRGRDKAFSFQNLFEGRSGARVGQVRVRGGGELFFKHDASDKIAPEVEKTEIWNQWIPGIIPAIQGRSRQAGEDSFVSEFLQGRMVRDIFLEPDEDTVRAALRSLFDTLAIVWMDSARPQPPAVDYVRQIRDRLEDLFRLHPRLQKARASTVEVCGARLMGLADTLDIIAAREASLAPPVSVWIHGDFNADNIIYDAARDRVRFVDVHRSGWGDYLQDVSVFLVSNIRNPMFTRHTLSRLRAINASVMEFASQFAGQIGDTHAPTRLQLARGRSLITSARLIADKSFAERLFFQGMYLLDCVAAKLAL